MIEYLKYLFQHLKAQNRKLTDISVIQDRSWVLFKEGNQSEKWLLEAGGNLIVSIEGDVTDGSWRYIVATNQIVIDCKGLKMLFNQNFLHENILLLRKDSSDLNFLAFYDDQKFSKQEFVQFLKDVKKRNIADTRARLNLTEIELEDGSKVELIRKPGQSSKVELGNIVIRNGEPVKELFVRTKDHKILELENGKIRFIYYVRSYKLEGDNEIIIKQKYIMRPQIGDILIKSTSKVNNGLHQLSSHLGIRIDSSTVKRVYTISQEKTFSGKQLKCWHTDKITFDWGYVFIDNEFAPDGKYWLTNFKLLKVKDGRIV